MMECPTMQFSPSLGEGRGEAVLFDMDGVLFNSMPYHARAWHLAMADYGFDLSVEEAYMHEGRTGFGTIQIVAGRQGREATRELADEIYHVKSGYFARAAAPNKKDLKLIEKCARKAVECALNGESGVVGPDENAAAKIRACEFPRIKGGKPFNVRKGSFRKLLDEINQPHPRKKRTVK